MVKDLQCKVENLPSRKIYAAFEQKNGDKQTCEHRSSWTQGIENILKDKLKNEWVTANESYATKIARAWCLVSSILSKRESLCSTICDFFYYWLGGILSENLSGWRISFATLMNEIYAQLQTLPGNSPCATIKTAPTTSTTFFKNRKIIFDYLYDCNTIRSPPQPGGKQCAGAYSTYKQEAEQKYGMVRAGCSHGTGSNDPCCKKLKEMEGESGTPIPQNLSQLTCTEVNMPQQLLACIEQQHQDRSAGSEPPQKPEIQVHSKPEGSATTSPIGGGGSGSAVIPGVSSILGIVGLPVTAFFLYKV
ncbi:KIR protein [Plasmodium coatneyi]|uniref:KIR protein n=1 Tax=Plasmodium coatneyi TaxID=208452 RepID=A0A1B1E6F2_9APIC|nr:KIR protein [Plasmodium coatneyi]ANQ10614.1 KIR protein [Plasmodium coatneyi]